MSPPQTVVCAPNTVKTVKRGCGPNRVSGGMPEGGCAAIPSVHHHPRLQHEEQSRQRAERTSEGDRGADKCLRPNGRAKRPADGRDEDESAARDDGPRRGLREARRLRAEQQLRVPRLHEDGQGLLRIPDGAGARADSDDVRRRDNGARPRASSDKRPSASTTNGMRTAPGLRSGRYLARLPRTASRAAEPASEARAARRAGESDEAVATQTSMKQRRCSESTNATSRRARLVTMTG